MKFAVGLPSTYAFPVRNCGDIPLDVDMEFTEWTELFSVCPAWVQLTAGQQIMSSVTFHHSSECRATQYERYIVL